MIYQEHVEAKAAPQGHRLVMGLRLTEEANKLLNKPFTKLKVQFYEEAGGTCARIR